MAVDGKVKPCTRFISYEFDQYILAEVFKVLKTPPLEMLKAALEETEDQERARHDWIESERERLEHEERTHGSAPTSPVAAFVVFISMRSKNWKICFKKKTSSSRKSLWSNRLRKDYESEEELEELCRLASDVPSLWHHAVVTNQERKEILRCLIDHVVVAATKEKIDATIFWKSGQQTPFLIWRGIGRYNLIRELHAQKLTVFEIKEHLAAGKTSTGQIVKITEGRLYEISGQARP